MRPATPSTVPIVPSVRHDGVRGRAADPGLGKAMAQATISPGLSSTGFRVASSEESALRPLVVFVIVFIKAPFAAWEGPRHARTFFCVEPGAYARTTPLVLWTMTSPSVTFGGFGRILSSFSSRTHSDATRVDSLA
jgi:hypothetical protein